MKKFIISILCVTLLCGCTTDNTNETESSSLNDTTQTDTTDTTGDADSEDGTTEESTTNVAQTDLQADAVGSQSYNTEKVVWGPGRAEEYRQPTDPVMLQEQYGNFSARFLLDSEEKICLTFDEGYENGYTPAILDTLKEKNVKAIFFVTYDFAKDNPDLIERMIDEGHTVGNHTYRHYTMDEVERSVAEEEITYLDNYIKEEFGYQMTLFRFPKGEFSEDTLALAQELGYESVFWSFAYADWDTQNPADPDEAYNEIISYTHPGEIMLLHAVSQTNAEILGDVIDAVREQGYTFTTQI
ncbi:MAG: polysaccharide deacetylase family protein [Clostridiales bacterium]|nr:polysaccharide deacetylase family protein [Clostridiales bacterium]